MRLIQEAEEDAKIATAVRVGIAKKLSAPNVLPELRERWIKWDAVEAEKERLPETIRELINKTQAKYK